MFSVRNKSALLQKDVVEENGSQRINENRKILDSGESERESKLHVYSKSARETIKMFNNIADETKE
ncbi:unnamed protein product, partial [Onchocerca ochengi]